MVTFANAMRWLVEVSSLGKTDTQSLCVEAESWQRALQAARTQRGEEGPMSGFSIELLEEGYRAVDPVARVRFVVKRAADDAPLTGPLAPADRRPSVGPAPAAKPASLAAQPAAPPAPQAPSVPAQPAAAPAPPAPARASVPAQAVAAAASTNGAAPIGSTVPGLPPTTLLASREQNPTDASPLTYREYAFAVPAGTNDEVAAEVLRAQLHLVEATLGDGKAGKLVNLAVFDVEFKGKPPRPPLATLTWKDWKGDPVLAFPQRGPTSQPPRPPSKVPPSMAAAAGPASPVVIPPAAPTPNVASVAVPPAPAAPPPAPAAPPPAPIAPAPVAAPAPAAQTAAPAAAPPSPAPVAAPPAAAAPAFPAPAPAAERPVPAAPNTVPLLSAVVSPSVGAQPVAAPQPQITPAVVEDGSRGAPSQPPRSQSGRASRPPSTPNATEGMIRTPSGRFVRGRVSGDELISSLFESMHDLHFLRDALDGGQFCLALATEVLPSRAALIHFFDIERREWVIACTRGKDTPRLLNLRTPEGDEALRDAARHRRAVVVTDAARFGGAQRYQTIGGSRSVIVAPIMQAGRALGALEIINPLDGMPFNDDEGNAMTYIAEQYAEYLGSRGIVLDRDRIQSAAAAR